MISFHLPINKVSFGQVGINLLKELYKRGEEPCVFPRNDQADLSALNNLPEGFQQWLNGCVEKALDLHKRKNRIINLWHINGLMQSFSEQNDAFTFHETNTLTLSEINILSQQRVVFVSSQYTKQVFEMSGLNNVKYCPLGFDSDSFHRLDKDFKQNDLICFGLRGKLEKRKHTLKILKAWAKKYGNNEKYRLDCSIQNPFMDIRQQEQILLSTFEGKVPWNINFLPYQQVNSSYNECLNAVDIDLTGMSGCEGFNLPLFQSLAIGKQAVVLNAHVHKDFCNDKNSHLVQPKGVIDAHDGMFFIKGQRFNQGTWFDFDDEEFIAAMEKAEKVAKERNTEGEKLAKEYTYSRMLDTLINNG